MTPLVFCAVLLAGALGAMLRYLTSRLLARESEPAGFPFAVLAVNCVGSFVSGLVIGWASADGLSTEWEFILVTGFAGGLTTFSTWSVETVQVLRQGRLLAGILSPAVNLVAGMSLVLIGIALTGA
jgi:CrcB protein